MNQFLALILSKILDTNLRGNLQFFYTFSPKQRTSVLFFFYINKENSGSSYFPYLMRLFGEGFLIDPRWEPIFSISRFHEWPLRFWLNWGIYSCLILMLWGVKTPLNIDFILGFHRRKWRYWIICSWQGQLKPIWRRCDFPNGISFLSVEILRNVLKFISFPICLCYNVVSVLVSVKVPLSLERTPL